MSSEIKCRICGQEFDPSFDFLEDMDALDALMFFVNIDELCIECTENLLNEIVNTVAKFEKKCL